MRNTSLATAALAAVILLLAVAPASALKPTGEPIEGIWINAKELATLPTSGPAWDYLRVAADRSPSAPNLADQNDPTNIQILAKALVYGRIGGEHYRQDVIDACMMAIGTEKKPGGDALSLSRELCAYVVAADIVKLPPDKDEVFRNWLRECLTLELVGKTVIFTHEDRPNNWGTHAGATRIAVDRYLGDEEDIEQAARVFKGYLGDRDAYAGFRYKDLWWQADPAKPVGVNPLGAQKDGHPIGGVLPDDMRRSGPFTWPPPKENYVYTGLQGVVAQAELLYRAGYTDVWEWEDQAILRAFQWLLVQADYPAEGNDEWMPHMINYHYDAGFPAAVPARSGKNMGWTDWTHGMRTPLPRVLKKAVK